MDELVADIRRCAIDALKSDPQILRMAKEELKSEMRSKKPAYDEDDDDGEDDPSQDLNERIKALVDEIRQNTIERLVGHPPDDIRNEVVARLDAFEQTNRLCVWLKQFVYAVDSPSIFNSYFAGVPRNIAAALGFKFMYCNWFECDAIAPRKGAGGKVEEIFKLQGSEKTIQTALTDLFRELAPHFEHPHEINSRCRIDIASRPKTGCRLYAVLTEVKRHNGNVAASIEEAGGLAQWLIYFLKAWYESNLNLYRPLYGIISNGKSWRFIRFTRTNHHDTGTFEISDCMQATGAGTAVRNVSPQVSRVVHYLQFIFSQPYGQCTDNGAGAVCGCASSESDDDENGK